MTHLIANPEAFLALKGVTMVITGGAIGIGREAAIEAHRMQIVSFSPFSSCCTIPGEKY